MSQILGDTFERTILETTGASSLTVETVIEELWSGYGEILRIALRGCERETVVVKHVRLPVAQRHPRGWSSTLSHDRKVFSYQVETECTRTWSPRCDDRCRIPGFLSFARDGGDVLLVLEDLDAAGYPGRRSRVHRELINLGLTWLAEFHATFMGDAPTGLWDNGTYWHLETRPHELDVLEDGPLKRAATAIDRRLAAARFQSLVHGDAKLANFCFSPAGDRVAALDFQYVGGGCGVKDVAYFIGSCLDEAECERHEAPLLDHYFTRLGEALRRRRPELSPDSVIAEWRELFPVAWTDFHRFMKGWCPGHWKNNTYSERIARQVIASLS